MLGVAVIGTGDISDYHIEAYLRFPERCRIRAVVDKFPEKAAAKAQKFGLSCDIPTEYRELLGRKDIDLVSVCLPPDLHCEVSCAFLLAGKHVLCEKPMAPSLEECDRMLAAAREGGAVLSTVAQNRFKADVMRTKRFLDSGALGRIRFAQASSLWWRGSRYYDLWWRGTWEGEGGGCTFIHAVHHIDMLLWLMGPAAEVTAQAANLGHPNSEVEDLSMAMVRFSSGALGSLVSSLLHHGEEQRFSVDCAGGTIEIPHRISVDRQLDNGYPEPDAAAAADLEARYGALPAPAHGGHLGQIDDMLRAVETGDAPTADAEAGRRTIEFISAVYRSAFLGGTVRLPLEPADPFYTRAGLRDHAPRFHRKTARVDGFSDQGISVGGTL